jgi:hypothetical protein
MKKKQQAIATYNERAQKLDNSARAELLKGASEDWTGAKEAATEAGKFELKALNLLRAAGQKLLSAANHDQLSFESFRRMKSALPSDMSFVAAQWCIKLGKEFDKPFESLTDAGHARRLLFVKLESQDVPRRLEEQSSHDHNPWSEMIAKGASVIAFISELTAEDPLEKWGPDKRQNFLTTYRPLVTTYLAVEALEKT